MNLDRSPDYKQNQAYQGIDNFEQQFQSNIRKMQQDQQLQDQIHIDPTQHHHHLFDKNPDWFAFETRIRKMVTQLIEPSVKRSVQDQIIISELKKQSDILKRKMDECEFIIHKAQKKTAANEDFHKKLEITETKMKMIETKFNEQLSQLHHKNEEILDKVEIVEQERSTFILRVDTMNLEIKKYREDIIHMKDQLHEYIENSHFDLKKTFSDFNLQMEKLQSEIQHEKAKLQGQNENFKSLALLIEEAQRKSEEVEGIVHRFNERKLDKQIFDDNDIHYRKEIRMLWDKIVQQERVIYETDQYLDRYLPLHTFNMIDEAIYATIQKKSVLVKSLLEYSKSKFKVLEDQCTQLEKPRDKSMRFLYQLPNMQLRELEIQRTKAQSRLRVNPGIVVDSTSSSGQVRSNLRLKVQKLESGSSYGDNQSQKSSRNKKKRQSIKVGGQQKKVIHVSHAKEESKMRQSDEQRTRIITVEDAHSKNSKDQSHTSLAMQKSSAGSQHKNQDSNTSKGVHDDQRSKLNSQKTGKSIQQIVELSEESIAESAQKSLSKKLKSLRKESQISEAREGPLIPEVGEIDECFTPMVNHSNVLEFTNQVRVGSRVQLGGGKQKNNNNQKQQYSQFVRADSISKIEKDNNKTSDKSKPDQLTNQVDASPHIKLSLRKVDLQSEDEEQYSPEDDEDLDYEDEIQSLQEEQEDEEESSDEEFQLTRSMIKRLSKPYVTRDDLDDNLQRLIYEMNQQLKDLLRRFPLTSEQSSMTWIKRKFEENENKFDNFKMEQEISSDQIEKKIQQIITQQNQDREFFQNDLLINEKKRKRAEQDLLVKIEELRKYVRHLEIDLRELQSKDNFYEGICLSLIETAKIDSILMEADEFDKQSIQLIGVKDEMQQRPMSSSGPNRVFSQTNLNNQVCIRPEGTNQPIVMLDKTCLSCSSQTSKVISAFKMACLSYLPSLVLYNDSNFHRTELIRIKQEMLNKVFASIKQRQFQLQVMHQNESTLNESTLEHQMQPTLKNFSSQFNELKVTGTPKNNKIDQATNVQSRVILSSTSNFYDQMAKINPMSPNQFSTNTLNNTTFANNDSQKQQQQSVSQLNKNPLIVTQIRQKTNQLMLESYKQYGTGAMTPFNKYTFNQGATPKNNLNSSLPIIDKNETQHFRKNSLLDITHQKQINIQSGKIDLNVTTGKINKPRIMESAPVSPLQQNRSGTADNKKRNPRSRVNHLLSTAAQSNISKAQ